MEMKEELFSLCCFCFIIWDEYSVGVSQVPCIATTRIAPGSPDN